MLRGVGEDGTVNVASALSSIVPARAILLILKEIRRVGFPQRGNKKIQIILPDRKCLQLKTKFI